MTSTAHTPYIVPRLVDEKRSFELDSYLIHKRTTTCASCASVFESSQCFEVWALRSAHAEGGASRRLVPVTAPPLRPHLPIGLCTLKPETTPVCFKCYGKMESAEHRTNGFDSEAEWRETLKRKYSAPSVAARKSVTEDSVKSKMTVDML